ncbi:hypothetical protein MTsPCn9_24410 [Croceitalea sp. MTPC9]|uniref:substrate-binding periplasmic protein n=1 Tax=unclassified Croceitalea TaxID=2632280 RepID=UPI002B3D751E|nr:hypothetical protein MTsPCn6_19130 [Croceitalea sp. MTPC6]GMN17503.1 hypothetical protein MTsPCn9_24410 [Croceitalea sp. MTPC9]
MKKPIIGILVSLIITFTTTGQEIRIGVNNKYPNQEFENQVAKGNINYIDAFEYELQGLLYAYSTSLDYTIEFIEIPQNERELSIISSSKINSLLYTFSYTPERLKKGILFSDPYLQNKAIVAISNNANLDVESWKETTVRVGHLKNTTAERELKLLKDKNFDNIIMFDFTLQLELIEALKKKEIDMAIGDINRLLYEIGEGDFHFAGNLPTSRAKIADDYCIGVAKDEPELVIFFNLFLRENKDRIKGLERKWLNTSLEDAYGKYYGKTKEELKSSLNNLKIIFLGSALALLFVILLLGYRNKKLKEKAESNKASVLEQELRNVIDNTKIKMERILDDDGIVKAGIQMFDSANESIHYYGSGGFMSSLGTDRDGKNAERWSDAIKRTLSRKSNQGDSIQFVRVVDLPEVELNEEFEKKSIVERNNLKIEGFSTGNNYPKYLKKYHRWLFNVYAQLLKYDNLKLYDSASAGLWGFGMIFIIKDDNEVLMFISAEGDKKIGTIIPSSDLAKELKEKYETDKVGQRLTNPDFTSEKKGFFFMEAEKVLLKEIDEAGGDLDCNVPKSKGSKIKIPLREKIEEFCENNYK